MSDVLALTKALIEMHGGRLLIASVPTEGTRVTVLLPAERTVVAAESLLAAS